MLRESLTCERQNENLHDRYAVRTILQGMIVGHVPKNISCLCSSFLGQRGTITAAVIGNRQHSYDLLQGGLEMCVETFAKNCEWRQFTKTQIVLVAKISQFSVCN